MTSSPTAQPIDPSTALASIVKCFKEKIPVYFSGSSNETVFQTLVVELLQDCVIIKNTIPYDLLSQVLTSDMFYLHCDLNQYAANVIESDGENIVFRYEKIVNSSETRESDRIYSYKKDNFVEFVNPYDRTTVLKKKILEYSVTGCSVKSHSESQLFTAGTRFDRMSFSINGRVYNNSGNVVYTKKILGLDGKTYRQVGIKFDDRIR